MLLEPSDCGEPIFITVWNLLPPSRFTDWAYFAGVGVYHTNVWIGANEYAFGGHDVPGVTGIFSLPIPQDSPTTSITDGLSFLGPTNIPAPGSPPLPGARYIGSYFLGYAGEPDPDDTASNSDNSSSPSRPSKSGRWKAPQTGPRAFMELSTDQGYQSSSDPTDLGSRSNGESISKAGRSAIRARSLSFVIRTIQEMKASPEWHGTAYDLLNHNCNHFSDSLVNKLTGAKLPPWINRTAGIANSLRFLVPTSLIGLDEIETSANANANANANSKVEGDRREEMDREGSVDDDVDQEKLDENQNRSEKKEKKRKDSIGPSTILYQIADAETHSASDVPQHQDAGQSDNGKMQKAQELAKRIKERKGKEFNS